MEKSKSKLKEIDLDNLDFTDTSITDILNICLKCKNGEDAKKVLERYEQYCNTPEIARKNLGYIFGYLNEEDRKRMYSLFPVDHPFFGHEFGREDDKKINESVLKFAIGGIIKGHEVKKLERK